MGFTLRFVCLTLMCKVWLTMGSAPASHSMWPWGFSCLHGAKSTVELQLAYSCAQTHMHQAKPAWKRAHNVSGEACFVSARTTFSSSGTHRSWRSLCSALAHVVLLMSNLSLNLKPATTCGETNRKVSFHHHAPHICPSPRTALPVWWCGRRCSG